MTSGKLDFSSLQKALATLETAVGLYERKKASVEPEERDLLRDGVIQRFEYTFELAWKTMKRFLEMYALEKVDALSNRDLFRLGYEKGLIQDPVTWLDYLTDRNQTSHLYNQNVASDVYDSAHAFLADATYLLAQLEERTK